MENLEEELEHYKTLFMDGKISPDEYIDKWNEIVKKDCLVRMEDDPFRPHEVI